MIEFFPLWQIILTIILCSIYYNIKYSRYNKCIKWYKKYSIELAQEWIQSEKSHQKLLWNIVDNPWVIKYIKKNYLKQEQKKLPKDLQ